MAWAAGLFEGEGSISILDPARYRRDTGPGGRGKPWAAVSVTSTDKDVLDRFHEIVGIGGVSFGHRGARPHHKDCWKWQVSARDKVEKLLLEFMPWLGQRRRAKAEETLALFAEIRIIRECEHCGAKFESYKGFQRFCCRKHQEQAWHEANKASGRSSAYQREYYLKNREAGLARARQQRERAKHSA